MSNRAVIQILIIAAPIYNRYIISAYALSDFDSCITNCGDRQLYLSDVWQLYLTTISSGDAKASISNYRR